MSAPSLLALPGTEVPACCEDETWEMLPGWPHEISSCGRVRSVDRRGDDGIWRLGQMLPQCPDRRPRQKDYLYVVLLDGKRRRRVHVAVAVLEAHRGLKAEPGHEARHGNAIRTDNHLSNLSWGTKRQNRGDRERHRMERECDVSAWAAPQGEPGVLITIREAAAEGWFPPTWSNPVKQFGVAKCKAAKAGDPVPATRAKSGHTIMYDAAELAAFICSLMSHVTESLAGEREAAGLPLVAETGTAAHPAAPLITVKEAERAGMFPAAWSKPAGAFRTAKHRAVRAGAQVPEVKAIRGTRALYDRAELARFVEAVSGHREGEEMRWFSLC